MGVSLRGRVGRDWQCLDLLRDPIVRRSECKKMKNKMS